MDFDDILADLGPQIKAPPITQPGLTLHVDGDYMMYYAAGPDDREEGEAKYKALELMAQARRASGASNIVVHNTASGCNKGERYVIATVKRYQGQRDPGRKPKNYAYLREWLLNYDGDAFQSKTWMTREADDGIGACSLHAVKGKPGYAAIFTRDKDMRMLPGLHVEWLTMDTVMVPPGAFEVVWKPERWEAGKEKVYGLKWFWLQMLHGDTADHIPGLEQYAVLNARGEYGLKKMGEKTAEKYLAHAKNNKDAFEIVSGLYRTYYDLRNDNWADRFCEQAALLWMRTDMNATVGDFARHTGASRISAPFTKEVLDGVKRLEDRVKNARTEADALAS